MQPFWLIAGMVLFVIGLIVKSGADIDGAFYTWGGLLMGVGVFLGARWATTNFYDDWVADAEHKDWAQNAWFRFAIINILPFALAVAVAFWRWSRDRSNRVIVRTD